MYAKYKIVPFCPYHFVYIILSSTILSVYHFVHTILPVPFCPLPFCRVTVRLGCLERIIRSAARLVGGIPRTGHLSAYLLDVLHWLPLQQRNMLRIGAMVWRCVLGLARPTSEIFAVPPPGTRGRCSLCLSEQGLLFVP